MSEQGLNPRIGPVYGFAKCLTCGASMGAHLDTEDEVKRLLLGWTRHHEARGHAVHSHSISVHHGAEEEVSP